MSNILDYKFYLNFKNVDSFGLIEISEPIKFDGASFIINQESKRYGRDAYKINEDINIVFQKGNFDTSDSYQLPNGTIVSNLTMGFDYLIDVYKRYGFESDVEFIIEKDNVSFITGNLDFQTSETDLLTYLSCKIVQATEKQTIKRREEYVVDMFSDEDADGNYIEPLTTTNILLKAKPVVQTSEWYVPVTQQDQVFSIDPEPYYFNGLNGVLKGEIENTLSFIYGLESNGSNFAFVEAQNDLTNVVVEASNIAFTIVGNISNVALYYRLGDVYADADEILIESLGSGVVTDTTHTYSDISYTLNLDIPRGNRLWIYFKTDNVSLAVIGLFVSGNQTITGTSTAIDTVIKGCRYIDLIKQTTKSISGLDVYADDFDVDGKFYSQFGFTGNLIKGRDDVAFPLKFKDIISTVEEVNQDYQILNDKVYIGSYEDFYANNEIGVFVSSPDDSFKSTFNNRFALNTFEYKYKKYEQDKDEANTIDAVHTDTQWIIKNKQVENKKVVELDQIRDPFKIEFSRKEAVKSTTSTSDDDNLFLIDVVELAPSSRGGFTASLTHNVNSDNKLQLLNDSTFSWALLGFGVGDEFNVVSDENNGTYTVFEITDNIITLTPVSTLPTFTGVDLTEVDYPYTNVLYTNRTNEGFDVIENIASSDKFSNLKYTIKRNIEYWKPFLASSTLFTTDTIRNSYFRNNGDLITKLIIEDNNVIEDADFDTINPVLTPFDYQTRLIAPFEDMIDVIDKINIINTDNSISGFIRCIDTNNKVIKLYPRELEFIPSTETLTLTGEERYESDVLVITLNANNIIINEVGYDLEDLNDVWYEFNGDYLIIYDSNSLPVINPTRYDNVEVNGNIFDNAINLMNYFVNN